MKTYLCMSGHEFDEPVVFIDGRRTRKSCPHCDIDAFGVQSETTVKNCAGGIHWTDPEFNTHDVWCSGEWSKKDIDALFKKLSDPKKFEPYIIYT